MSQKQLYTEFWKVLSLAEDYVRFGKRSGEYSPPQWQDPKHQTAPPAGPDIQSKSESPVAPRPNTDHPLVHLDTREACSRCPVARMGKTAVPAIGAAKPKLLVLCGPPSVRAEENHVPLAAEEMDYFLKWMAAIDLDMEKDVLLMNFPRCRMPGNRPPFPEEMSRCAGSIEASVSDLAPAGILTLGPVSSAYFLDAPGRKVSELRGMAGAWKGIPVLATFSPDQVLNFDELKRPVWEDLKKVRDLLNARN